MAKELLLSAGQLVLPEWTDGEAVIPSAKLSLHQQAAQEVRLLDGQMRPDIQVGGSLGDIALPSLFVEIKVSHGVDWKKSALARLHGISMIEIDLSNATDEQVQDHESFVAMVLSSVENRTWVNLADPLFIASSLGEDVFEVQSLETFLHAVPTKKGNTMHFTKQKGILHRAGEEPKPVDFEIADTYNGDRRVDGLGNDLPYGPGLYARASARPTAYSYGSSLFYKTFLRPLKIAREERQSQLFQAAD